MRPKRQAIAVGLALLLAVAAAGGCVGTIGSGVEGTIFQRERSVPLAAGAERATPIKQSGAAPQRSARVTVLFVDGLSFAEWSAPLPALQRLRREGAIGAMNVRTGAGLNDAPTAYLSIGYGKRMDSAPSLGGGWDAGEPMDGIAAAEWMRLWTGHSAEGANVVVPAYARWLATLGGPPPVSLGAVIAARGEKAAVYGNADRGDARRRYAALVTMDEQGRTAYGAVGPATLQAAPDGAYGVRTDADALLARWRADADRARLRVMEWGDLERLYAKREWYAPDAFAAQKRAVLYALDRLLGGLLAGLAPGELLVVASPSVNVDAAARDLRLTPIAVYGGDTRPGLLTSPSTERRGIVTLPDVAPTLLAWLGYPPAATMDGRAMRLIPDAAAADSLQREAEQIASRYALRPAVLYGYIAYQVAVILVALAAVLKRWSNGYARLKTPLLTLLLAPFAFLLMSVYEPMALAVYGALFALLTWAPAYALSKLPYRAACGIAAALSVIALIGDGMSGERLMRRSLLGYDPIIGARFYGIGNEYMGVLVGAALLLSAVWLEGSKKDGRARVALFALYAAVVVYFALPFWGANAGGALAACVGFGYSWLRTFRRASVASLGGKAAAAAALLIAGLLLLYAGNRLLAVGTGSHIGRAFEQLAIGNWPEIVRMIERKLAMNVKLVQHSAWSKLFLTALFAMAVCVWRPVGLVRRWKARYPRLAAGFSAIVATALAALLLNDSGIVAAATTIVFAVVPMLLLPIAEAEEAQKKAAQLSSSSASHSS